MPGLPRSFYSCSRRTIGQNRMKTTRNITSRMMGIRRARMPLDHDLRGCLRRYWRLTTRPSHSGPKGSLLPGTNLRSAPDSSILTVRMTPPDEPSRAIAWLSALTTNSSHCAAFMPGR